MTNHTHEAITLVENSIHNPGEPRHFMTVTEQNNLWHAEINKIRIASSDKTLDLREVGYNIYDRMIYFPSVSIEWHFLEENSKTTSCPLKGKTKYYNFSSGETFVANVAWSYSLTIPEAIKIRSYVAFDTKKILLSRSY